MPKKRSAKTITVTRIASIGGSRKLRLNQWKQDELDRIASVLGQLRCDLWNEFGALKAWGVSKYEIDKRLRLSRSRYAVPAKLWEATLYDVIDDIHACQASCIEKVLKRIGMSYRTSTASKTVLQHALESGEWRNHPKLSTLVRKYWFRGHTAVANQIVVKAYDIETDGNGVVWLRFGSLEKRQLKLPTTLPHLVKCQLRLICKDGTWRIHYTTDIPVAEQKATGKIIGCDRGYSEVYATSSNDGARFLGESFGSVQTAETDYRTEKSKHRQRLWALARKAEQSGKPEKAARIRVNNLGRVKWNRREARFKGQIKTMVYTATLALMRNASMVAYEDLTSQIKNTKRRSKRMKRNVSSWCKGVVSDALQMVSRRVGCSAVSVNCAYTSQLDSRFGVLLGTRSGDKFTGFDGVVLHSDTNAADNVLARMGDSEIPRFLKHTSAKEILLERTQKFLALLEAKTGKDKPQALDRPKGGNQSANIKQLTLFNYG